MTHYAPQTGTQTAAAGGLSAPPPNQGEVPPQTAPGPSGMAQDTGPDPIHPDAVLPLDAPSQRPSEPVTAGLPFGPGVGPDPNVQAPAVTQWSTARDVIAQAAANPSASPALQMLASRLQAGI